MFSILTYLKNTVFFKENIFADYILKNTFTAVWAEDWRETGIEWDISVKRHLK